MKILFVCTGNTCRSPMAEGLLKDRVEKFKLDLEVGSAGIFAVDGHPISLNSIRALAEDGIDIDDYTSRKVDRDLLEEQDLILAMSESHKNYLLSNYEFLEGRIQTVKAYAYGSDGDVLDPFGGDLATYLSTKEELKKAVDEIVRKILES